MADANPCPTRPSPPAGGPGGHPAEGRPPAPRPARSRLAAALVGQSRRLGSLRLALVLLPLFGLVLFLGTLVESWYDSAVAQQLVYRAWWFAALLGLLGANVFFAAAKKWPWKRHQVGFLVTHLGLLTLVAGGLLNGLFGTSATMVLVDSPGPRAAAFGAHASDFAFDRDVQTVRVRRPGGAPDLLNAPFAPGPLPWRADGGPPPRADRLAALLGRLADPRPRGWSRGLGDRARLDVLAYYPHVRQEPYGPAPDDAGPGAPAPFPAVRLQLTSSLEGPLPSRWVAAHAGDGTLRLGRGLIEVLGSATADGQVEQFRNPPARPGPRGRLVLGLGGRAYPLDGEAALDRPTPLGDSGWTAVLLRAGGPPDNPAATFRLEGPGGAAVELATRARQGGALLARSPKVWRQLPPVGVPPGGPEGLWAWYHPPDPRYGDAGVEASLGLLAGPDGRLWYRTAFRPPGGDGLTFETSGTASPGGGPLALWQGLRSGDRKPLRWQLRVLDYLPRAAPGPHFVPEERRPGLEEEETAPAVFCRLTAGTGQKEFWVGKTEFGLTPVDVNGERFLVGYNDRMHRLDFTVTLVRAEQPADPATGRPAGQISYVLLTDPGRGVRDEPHAVALNAPLAHRGYRLYQAGYLALGTDEAGRPVSRSLLTLTRDPGLGLKYAGSVMVALGIFCMFTMRAYFFKRAAPREQP